MTSSGALYEELDKALGISDLRNNFIEQKVSVF